MIIDNKRIAKNTMYMYIRMIVVMLVQLYTSRIVLNNLGIDNYGIYNVVASLIVAFTFIKGPLSTATQRFLNFEMGRCNKERPNIVFNVSVWIHIGMAFVLFLFLELVGDWFIDSKMQIPQGRETATQFAFQLSLLSLVFNVIKMPFDALIISNERLSFYAILGVVEVIMKLLNALSLSFFAVDKLELYAINHLIIDIVIFLSFYYYCKTNLPKYRLMRVWDRKIFRDLISFTGWGVFGAFAAMTATQGVNILINIFWGVAVNAAIAIAIQVNTAISSLVSNFQIAFRPQIMKSYAAGQVNEMNNLLFQTSKYSYLLLFLLICPFWANSSFLLELWLKNPPQYADDFVILLFAYSLINAISAPFWMAIYAVGKIRDYQIAYSTIYIMNICFSYILLSLGMMPHSVLVIRLILEIAVWLLRVGMAKKVTGFTFRNYINSTVQPCFLISLLNIFVIIIVQQHTTSSWNKLLTTLIIFFVLYPISTFYLGLSSAERTVVVNKLKILKHNSIKL